MDAELNDQINTQLEFLEKMKEVLDMVDAYRAECLRRDYGEQAAEAMSVMFHGMILANMAEQNSKG